MAVRLGLGVRLVRYSCLPLCGCAPGPSGRAFTGRSIHDKVGRGLELPAPGWRERSPGAGSWHLVRVKGKG
eukprot:scaffold10286_cov41-Phaeocystis_antarctica.AAC.2